MAGERLKQYQNVICKSVVYTYYIACCHFTPRRLLTAALRDKTREVNQNPLTPLLSAVVVSPYENCIIVAVTAEQKVANVERFSKLVVVCFCCD